MKRFFAGLVAALIACVGTARAEAPPVVAPGVPVGTGLQPVAIYDASGNIVSSFGGGGGGGGGATGSVTPAGTNGTAAQAIQGINGGVNVGVSATSWPLPTGAATLAAQTTGNASLASLDAKTPALVGGRQPVDGSGVTQPISAVSLPLPTGAATSAGQVTPQTAGAAATGTGLRAMGTDGAAVRDILLTTLGAFEPPTCPAGSGKCPAWFAQIAANTSAQLLPANAARIGVSIQCTGTAQIAVSETGATLTTATPASGSGISLVIPAGSFPYFGPQMASRSAITGYSGTAQSCWGTEYLR